jgi:hypothetical protein
MVDQTIVELQHSIIDGSWLCSVRNKVTSTNVAAHKRGCDLPAILAERSHRNQKIGHRRADYSCNYQRFRQVSVTALFQQVRKFASWEGGKARKEHQAGQLNQIIPNPPVL